MTDPSSQLAVLRALRAAVADPVQGAALDALIASLESAEVAEHQQRIGGNAQVGVAVAGDVHGGVHLYGMRTKSAAQLLATYLQGLARRCTALPLQGVREQRSAADVLQIGLERVYTQLAISHLKEREVFAGESLTGFDAKTYRAQHVGDEVLPAAQRRAVRSQRRDAGDEQHTVYQDLAEDRPLWLPGPGRLAGLDLTTLSAEELERRAGEADRLVFYGPQLVTEAIADQPRLVLLGQPGSGKSTALRYLALTLAAAGLDESINLAERLQGWDTLAQQGRFLPVLLPLLRFARRLAEQPDRPANADDLWEHIAERLEAPGGCAGLADVVCDELRAGHVLLLLDGLDEVVGAESRRQVVRAVRAFGEAYPQCRIVVTCRVRAYEGEQNQEWRLPGWPTATLDDWTIGQMQHFVTAWYDEAATASTMAPDRRDERKEQLRAAIRRRGDLQRLGTRPLLLTMMALVHFNDGRLPEDRVSLYGRCVDLLLGQWEVARDEGSDYKTLIDYIQLPPDRDVKILRPLLTRAAFAAHSSGTREDPGSLGRAELREMVAQTLADLKHANPWEGAGRFLEYTDTRAGLLQASDAGDAYVFPHQTFQEYLAGLELVRGVEFVQRIMDHRADDRWHVPILLGIGHLVSEGSLAEPYRLLCKLVQLEGRAPEQQQRDFLLAAEIADDVGWDRLELGDTLFTRLRADLARELARVVEGAVLPGAERVRAGLYLGQLGDPRDGVCKLPPAMIELPAGKVMLGMSAEEAATFSDEYIAAYRAAGNEVADDLERGFRELFRGWVNDRPLPIAPFELARCPVTNAQYKLFLDDDGYDSAQPWWDDDARAWLARDDAATEGLQAYQRRRFKKRPEWWNNTQVGIARPNHPVVGISWYEAMAFCRWLTQNQQYNPEGYNYTLPSEAEWEYAARGAERRQYPWGMEEPNSERANFNRIYDGTTAVGCFPSGATQEGVLDLAGNVWEWTRSGYAPYPYDPEDGREDITELAGKYFTFRGGGWYDRPISLRASNRSDYTPDDHFSVVGFRLARHPSV